MISYELCKVLLLILLANSKEDNSIFTYFQKEIVPHAQLFQEFSLYIPSKKVKNFDQLYRPDFPQVDECEDQY